MQALTNEQLDRVAAEVVMGWGELTPGKSLGKDESGYLLSGLSYVATGTGRFRFFPTKCHNDAALIRAEIARRGLQEEFSKAILDILYPTGIPDSVFYLNEIVFTISNATPRQTTEAAVLAVQS